ncbi:MAG TPA: polysaccharide pyruvyl transferase family protein, partial [Novosphingobium sp.]|nr:polysaccharide pyruvyl transferase family protein [Novosphingobium sp.]
MFCVGPGTHDPQATSLLPTADTPSELDSLRKYPRLRLFNVKYSPNLGDGLLSECLEQALVDLGAHPDTQSIDLAARSSFGTASRSRSAQMRLLEALPAKVRQLAVRVPLAVETRRRWRPHYRASLVETDAMVIGGGNLLADIDLNFPTKIAIAIQEAALRQIPVYIYGCGVSRHWSRRGQDLLRSALDLGMVKRVFVRDEPSRLAWNNVFGAGSGLPAQIVRDPGLLAMERYRIACRPATDRRPMIGLNVTSQLALRYHGADVLSRDQMDAW